MKQEFEMTRQEYENEAGLLINNVAFMALKEMAL